MAAASSESWKDEVRAILQKMIGLEPRVPDCDSKHPLKDEISEHASELNRIGSDKVTSILQDIELRSLLKSCQCNITCGYSFKDTDFWRCLSSCAKALDETILIQSIDGVVCVFQKEAELSLEQRLQNKTILFVGEKDFSFTNVFIATHKGQAEQVIASAYNSFDELLSPILKSHDGVDTLIPLLEAVRANVILAFGIDATKLHEYPFLRRGPDEEKFKRIQFNCPYADDEAKAALDRPKTKELIAKFLTSATPLLDPDAGRLHLAVQQPKDSEVHGAWNWRKKTYQQVFGLTPTVTAAAGLTFVKVLGDIKGRYQRKVESAVTEGAVPHYAPDIGVSSVSRVNQFIFRPGDYFDYVTDEGESEDEGRKLD